MKRFDPRQGPRADHFAWFRGMAHPWLAVTVEVDVTGTLEAARAAGVGRFAAVAHALTAAANAVPELRQRLRPTADGEEIVEHEAVDAGLTLPGDAGAFAFGRVPSHADLAAFAAGLDEARGTRRTGLTPLERDGDDLVFLSCLPWVRFTQVDHPVRDPSDCIPRIAWGRLTTHDGRTTCPVNLHAHHALVDGAHLGRFFQVLEAGA